MHSGKRNLSVVSQLALACTRSTAPMILYLFQANAGSRQRYFWSKLDNLSVITAELEPVRAPSLIVYLMVTVTLPE